MPTLAATGVNDAKDALRERRMDFGDQPLPPSPWLQLLVKRVVGP